jgi:hypothetical protein
MRSEHHGNLLARYLRELQRDPLVVGRLGIVGLWLPSMSRSGGLIWGTTVCARAGSSWTRDVTESNILARVRTQTKLFFLAI